MILNIKEFIEFNKEIDKKILLNSEILKIILFMLKKDRLLYVKEMNFMLLRLKLIFPF